MSTLPNYPPILNEQALTSLLVGMALGDAGINLPPVNVNAHISITHTEAQFDYLDWKIELIRKYCDFSFSSYTWLHSIAKTNQRSIRSKTHPFLTDLRHKLYDPITRKKYLTRELLDTLDDRALAIWFMDDGCLYKRIYKPTGNVKSYEIIISTQSFSREDVQLLSDWLNERYGASFNINECTGKDRVPGTYVLRGCLSKVIGFMEAIKPYVEQVPCMAHKVDYKIGKQCARKISERS